MNKSENEILHQLWSIELEILDVIDQICVAHNLRYSPIYGTLLGAVRHKGFIPWDDDIDLMMPRDDYEAFLGKRGLQLHDIPFVYLCSPSI